MQAMKKWLSPIIWLVIGDYRLIPFIYGQLYLEITPPPHTNLQICCAQSVTNSLVGLVRSIGGSVLVSEGSFNVYLGSKRDGFQENSNNYSIGNHFFKVLVQIHYSLFIHYRPGLVIIFYPSISFYSIFAIVGFIVHDKVRELGLYSK